MWLIEDAVGFLLVHFDFTLYDLEFTVKLVAGKLGVGGEIDEQVHGGGPFIGGGVDEVDGGVGLGVGVGVVADLLEEEGVLGFLAFAGAGAGDEMLDDVADAGGHVLLLSQSTGTDIDADGDDGGGFVLLEDDGETVGELEHAARGLIDQAGIHATGGTLVVAAGGPSPRGDRRLGDGGATHKGCEGCGEQEGGEWVTRFHGSSGVF